MTHRNKILIVTPQHFPQDLSLKQQAITLSQKGHKVTVCVYAHPLDKGDLFRESIENITVFRISPLRQFQVLGNLKQKGSRDIITLLARLSKRTINIISRIKLFFFIAYLRLMKGFKELVIPKRSYLKMDKTSRILGMQLRTLKEYQTNIEGSGRLTNLWMKVARKQPMVPKKQMTLIKDVGIEDNVAGKKRQITIINKESWERLTDGLGVAIDPGSRRANLMVSGIELNNIKDRVLRIGNCRFLILGETKPCKQMDEVFQGLRNAMSDNWAGGSFAQVLTGGTVEVGEIVCWENQGKSQCEGKALQKMALKV